MKRFKTEVLSIKGGRSYNEDSCVVQEIGDDAFFLAVADGMGGKAGGNLASKLALASASNYLEVELKNREQAKNLKEVLAESFLIAQTAIADYYMLNPLLKGMGTTMTAVLIHKNSYVWGNIGDSRIYLLTGGRMHLLTEDHTYVNDFLKNQNKELPPSVLNRYRNIVTRIIDGGTSKPDIFPREELTAELKEGDLFLLCSDGMIIDKTGDQSKIFKDIISSVKSLKSSARMLTEWALDNGSEDNISVILGLFGSIKKIYPDEQ